MNKKHLCLVLFFIVLLFSFCGENEVPKTTVVRVFDQELSLQEVANQIDDDLNLEDSAIMATGIIENWVKTKMLISQAERNLPDSLKDFTRELEAEKNSLLIYTYENEYIKEKLDTLISDQEILEYYESNKASFILSDYILRYRLIKVPSSFKNIDIRKVKSLLSSSEDITDEIRDFCSEIGATYSIDSAHWWYLEEFLENVPIEVYNNESFLKKQKFTDFESENFRYFVYIPEYKLKDEEAPLDVVSQKIKTLILNRRKQATIKKLRSDLYQQAIRENQIKYFE